VAQLQAAANGAIRLSSTQPWLDKENPVPIGFWQDKSNQKKCDFSPPPPIALVSVYSVARGLPRACLSSRWALSSFKNWKRVTAFFLGRFCLPWRHLFPSFLSAGRDIVFITRYFTWLGEQVGIKKPEDWYQVKKGEVNTRGGAFSSANFSQFFYSLSLQVAGCSF